VVLIPVYLAAANGYKGLMVIERCFRLLKSTQIKLTPIFHWTSQRIEAHVRICVLALLIERVAEHACGTSWTQIRDTLETLQATEFRTKSFQFFRRNEVSHQVAAILKSLDISIPKAIIRIKNLN